MKNVIVYYSHTHNNEKLAHYLGEKLSCDTIKIETVKEKNFLSIYLDLMFSRLPALKPLSRSLAEYDHVIFISPVWTGKISTPLKACLKQEKSMIGQYSFISLCGGGPGQKEKIDQELFFLLGRKPRAHVELSLKDLLPIHKKDNVKDMVGYRVSADELVTFEPQLRDFIQESSLIDAV